MIRLVSFLWFNHCLRISLVFQSYNVTVERHYHLSQLTLIMKFLKTTYPRRWNILFCTHFSGLTSFERFPWPCWGPRNKPPSCAALSSQLQSKCHMWGGSLPPQPKKSSLIVTSQISQVSPLSIWHTGKKERRKRWKGLGSRPRCLWAALAAQSP